jgi:hypothetical protein
MKRNISRLFPVSCQIPIHKAELGYKLSCLLEWLPSEKNLRIAEGEKVGGIPRYFTSDWRRIVEDKSRAPCPIIKKGLSSPLTIPQPPRLSPYNCACTLVNKWEFICILQGFF